MTHEEWKQEAARLFGDNPLCWAFVCPVCGKVQTVQDYRDAGAPEGAVAFSCIGRWTRGAKEAFDAGDNSNGCTYAGGGLFNLNPIKVTNGNETLEVFDFASATDGGNDA